MRIDAFDYHLSPERIAQEPLPDRASSRLLVLPREAGPVRHERFRSLPGLLGPGDLLVLNDARVFPARLRGRKPTGGRVEVLLLARMDDGGPDARCQEWEALLGGAHPPGPGGRISVADDLMVEVLAPAGDGAARVRLRADGPVDLAVDRRGEVPLPPYIRRDADDPRLETDRRRYQTVYARRRGAAAAPTAGLHFTTEILDEVRSRGVAVRALTLEVGLGTFRPVTAETLEEHHLHAERYHLPGETAEAVSATRAAGGRVVAVGTTVARVLEHVARRDGVPKPGTGWCDLFIRPGHPFRAIDGLVTNFHLPRSTLLVLVAALAGRERVLEAYAEAIRRGYRFYSYGDAMLVIGSAERSAPPG